MKENPYLTGRREWMERYGGLIARERAWRRLALLSLLIAGVAVAGAITLAHRTRFVPYVVEVEPDGRIRGAGFPRPGLAPEPLHIKAFLAGWVERARSVWTDGAAQRRAVRKTFASLSRGDPAFTFVSRFSRENWKRARHESVSVEITGAPLPITDRSWQIEWRESVHSVGGELLRTEDWKATLEIYTAGNPPRNILLDNPLGIYIRTIDWTRRN